MNLKKEKTGHFTNKDLENRNHRPKAIKRAAHWNMHLLKRTWPPKMNW